MDIDDDTVLQDLGIFPYAFMVQLEALGVTTLGELLGATRGFQQVPSPDPDWVGCFQRVQELISQGQVAVYQEALPLPPTGLRPLP